MVDVVWFLFYLKGGIHQEIKIAFIQICVFYYYFCRIGAYTGQEFHESSEVLAGRIIRISGKYMYMYAQSKLATARAPL